MNFINSEIIATTIQFVKAELKNAEAGHDWFHIERVWKLSKKIAEKENVDFLVVELAALLHDIADSKFHDGDETIGPEKAEIFLKTLNLDGLLIDHIKKIIQSISFKGGNFEQTFFSPELAVVQDADRMDAIGAIGIARAFHFGGFKNRALYDPEIRPNPGMDKEAYKKSNAPTFNHFYEKLLLLKDRMNTQTGRELAQTRHDFMLQFLSQFIEEWQ